MFAQNFSYTESLLAGRVVGTLLKFRFPDRWPILQEGLHMKNSSLRPAMLKWPQRVKHDWVTKNTQHVLSIAQNVKVLKSIAELKNQQKKTNEGFSF